MEKPIMIPAAAPFLILSSRIMHQKRGANCAIIKDTKPMETNILKQNFIDGKPK
jgi:hypothetical protein